MSSRRVWLIVLVVALAYVVVELQWSHAIAWDELEYFRATKWTAEGRVPFRDFWEHHLPLQWYVFAPAAALFGNGPGAAAILAMRWIQLPLWIAAFALLFAIMRRAGLEKEQARLALLLLPASSLFVSPAVEYRVDTLGSACYLAALAVALLRPHARASWIGFGALMSAAVLANMRLMPIVVLTALLLLFFRGDERRWRWNAIAMWMLPGIAIVATAFVVWLAATGATNALIEAIRYNVVSNRMLLAEARTFVPVLLLPFTAPDFGAIALSIAAIAGALLALRAIRSPGILQLLALLAIASVVFVSRLGVHYIYHLQLTFLLLAPLAVIPFAGERMQRLLLPLLAIVVSVNLGRLFPAGAFMAYQDTVMREADRRTLPAEHVWDGCGYALRREPAYRYWFLPSGVRMMASRGLLEPYDAPQMIAAPPAAIVHSYRVHLWLRTFPRAASYATHHYLPLYRDLWIPAFSAVVEPRSRVTWIAPRAGRYRLYASDLLLKHPWFQRPLDYAMYAGDDATLFTVPLNNLALAGMTRARLTIEGRPAGRVFDLRKGAIVRLESAWEERMAVIIVPDDVTTLFMSTPAKGIM